jgi:hypothetical protein
MSELLLYSKLYNIIIWHIIKYLYFIVTCAVYITKYHPQYNKKKNKKYGRILKDKKYVKDIIIVNIIWIILLIMVTFLQVSIVYSKFLVYITRFNHKRYLTPL